MFALARKGRWAPMHTLQPDSFVRKALSEFTPPGRGAPTHSPPLCWSTPPGGAPPPPSPPLWGNPPPPILGVGSPKNTFQRDLGGVGVPMVCISSHFGPFSALF